MVIERIKDEIVIRIQDDSNDLGQNDLDRIIDTIKYCQIIKKSKATQSEIDALANEVNSDWWSKNRARFELSHD